MDVKEFVDDYLEIGLFDYIAKGTQLFNEKGREIIINKRTKRSMHLTVPESGNTHKKYEVVFSISNDDEYLISHCACRIFKEEIDCKHCAAAALFIANKRQSAIVLKTISPKKKPIETKSAKSSSGDVESVNSQLGYLFDFAERDNIYFSLQLLAIKEMDGKFIYKRFPSSQKQLSEFQ